MFVMPPRMRHIVHLIFIETNITKNLLDQSQWRVSRIFTKTTNLRTVPTKCHGDTTLSSHDTTIPLSSKFVDAT
jgi:hypothetical protein